MTVFRNVPLDLDIAHAYADLSGIAQDLEFTIQVCELAEAIFARDSRDRSDFVFTEALSSAALVRYARCFVKGVRSPLSFDDLSCLSEAQRRDHHRFLLLRHRHIAHSVSRLEENIPVATVSDQPDDTELLRVSIHHTRVIGLGPREFADLKDVARCVLGEVRNRIAVEEAKVLAAAREIPYDDLRRRPSVEPNNASWEDVQKARGRRR